nr:MAG TPA: hypothetical protein [Caudoviricetes sp.]
MFSSIFEIIFIKFWIVEVVPCTCWDSWFKCSKFKDSIS